MTEPPALAGTPLHASIATAIQEARKHVTSELERAPSDTNALQELVRSYGQMLALLAYATTVHEPAQRIGVECPVCEPIYGDDCRETPNCPPVPDRCLECDGWWPCPAVDLIELLLGADLASATPALSREG
ncbi:hypothetical protein [Nocardioides campestrisoli]|uniref:hypothetical protein n=1 Tax=Nocardioides campestrisoli TaxID=2736757 RepID=UPI00163DE463|nr:hypothetical protein [Nocardioides campestrisoli]